MRKTWITGISCALAGAVAASILMQNFSTQNSARAANSDIYTQLNLFGNVFDRVRANYVEKPDITKLIDSAINGMLSSLDPHSSYMNADRHREMQVETRGEFGGLGIEVTMEKGLVKVVSPIDDTPAAKAGLLAGDLISHLDGDQVMGLTLQQAVAKMRGPVDKAILLTIVRKGRKPFDVRIVRAIVRIRAVRWRLEEDVGYIRITRFNQQTQENLNLAFKKLKAEIGDKMRGYIVDLRNNPGGLLDQAVSVSDTFLNRGEIVSTRGRNRQETQRFNANSGDLADGKPVIVLINGGSASASEIVAGALQDHKRARILGTKSFGKGSVQTIIPLGKHGALRLTTARYYTPSGRSIQAKGITPDIVVEQELPDRLKQAAGKPRGEADLRGHLKDDNKGDTKAKDDKAKKEKSGSSAYVPRDKSKDQQLAYALNLLRGINVQKEKPQDAKPKTVPN
jgi:carboxyl-terminal processing protease